LKVCIDGVGVKDDFVVILFLKQSHVTHILLFNRMAHLCGIRRYRAMSLVHFSTDTLFHRFLEAF